MQPHAGTNAVHTHIKLCGRTVGDRNTAKTEPERIQFASGATAARIEKTLSAGELHPYVLGIMAGQQLKVVLTPADGAVLENLGLDGTTLASWMPVFQAGMAQYLHRRIIISMSFQPVPAR